MSPASYRAAPPRVGGAILGALIDKDQIPVFIYLPCALIAASSADFNRF